LSLAYGWNPSEIANMTPAQICEYLDDFADEAVRWMSPAEARDYGARKREELAVHVTEQLRSDERGAPPQT
jgi:hypothetical protein